MHKKKNSSANFPVLNIGNLFGATRALDKTYIINQVVVSVVFLIISELIFRTIMALRIRMNDINVPVIILGESSLYTLFCFRFLACKLSPNSLLRRQGASRSFS